MASTISNLRNLELFMDTNKTKCGDALYLDSKKNIKILKGGRFSSIIRFISSNLFSCDFDIAHIYKFAIEDITKNYKYLLEKEIKNETNCDVLKKIKYSSIRAYVKNLEKINIELNGSCIPEKGKLNKLDQAIEIAELELISAYRNKESSSQSLKMDAEQKLHEKMVKVQKKYGMCSYGKSSIYCEPNDVISRENPKTKKIERIKKNQIIRKKFLRQINRKLKEISISEINYLQELNLSIEQKENKLISEYKNNKEVDPSLIIETIEDESKFRKKIGKIKKKYGIIPYIKSSIYYTNIDVIPGESAKLKKIEDLKARQITRKKFPKKRLDTKPIKMPNRKKSLKVRILITLKKFRFARKTMSKLEKARRDSAALVATIRATN